MASRIITKKGSGAPLASDLVHGELAVDTVNKRLYTEDAGGTVIEVGTNPSTIDINAGTIDGTVIGGSTAAAGTFTTFTSTGIDDNATSTAITIDASQNVGIGTSSPAKLIEAVATGAGSDITALQVRNNSGSTSTSTSIRFVNSTANTSTAGGAEVSAIRNASDGGALTFKTAADTTATLTERLRIDSSGNVGIGVTPSAWGSGFTTLQVEGSSLWSTGSDVALGANNYYDGTQYKYVNNGAASRQYHNTDGSVAWFQAGSGTAGNAISFTQAMTLDSSGNLMVGTTTESGRVTVSGTGWAHFQSNAASSNPSTTDPYGLWIGANRSNGDVEGNLAYRNYLTIASWDGSTYAERMRIDSSGNVGIGTSPTVYRLQVASGATAATSYFSSTATPAYSATAYNGGNARILLVGGNASGATTGINFSQGGAFEAYFGGVQESGGAAAFVWQGYNGSAYAERMRLDSSGKLLVGTTSTAALDGVNGAVVGAAGPVGYAMDDTTDGGSYLLYTTSGYFDIWDSSANSTRLRIDSSGNVLVGTTSSAPNGDEGIKLNPEGSGTNNPWLGISTSGYQTETCLSIYSTAVSAYRFFVNAAGTVHAVNTTITSLSDQRVKENVRDLDDGLTKVLQLQPRKFDWKKGHGKDISNDRGFIAQEFEQVFPDMIEEWKDKAPEGEEAYKAINANLIPTLVKAIQEQQVMIEDLKAEVAALKGAN